MTDVLLVGSGGMAADYAKVLKGLGVSVTVVGRGNESAQVFREATGLSVQTGGLESYLAQSSSVPLHAIVSVGVEQLHSTTMALLRAGVSEILVEKPGALTLRDLDELDNTARDKVANVYVAYNRRFYASVRKAKEILEEDGGVRSFCFEFTEWSHVIEDLKKAPGVKEHWFLSNSTHVIDLAFFLGGKPSALHPLVRGGLSWHPSGAVFCGAGETVPGVLFSYHANWDAPGRWWVEVLTEKRRLILRPLEKLEVVLRGSVKIDSVEIDDALDREYKPGLYRQVQAFLEGSEQLCSLSEHCANTRGTYYPMSGYQD